MNRNDSQLSHFVPTETEFVASWMASCTEEELANLELFPGVLYGGIEWRSREHAAGCKERLLFNLKITSETRFDDPEHRDIYIATRRSLAALRLTPPDDCKQLHSFGTFYLVASKARLFAAWLMENGFTSFSQVTEAHLACFLEDYANRPGRRKRERLSAVPVRQMIHVLHLLWHVRGSVPNGLQTDILRGRSAAQAAREITTAEQWSSDSTPAIPESVFVPLLQSALNWIENKIPLLMPLQEFVDREDITIGCKRIEAANFDWTPFLSFEQKPLTRRGGPLETLRRVRRLAVTACFIVIAAFTGMRPHELLALKEDCIVDLPEWAEYYIFRIRSRNHKGSKRPQGVELTWVAPMIVKVALKLLSTLTQSQRKRIKTKFLFPAARLDREEKIRGTITRNVREFAAHVGVGAWVNSANGETEVWSLCLHQFRKTFAKWVGAATSGSLYALKQHYKHVQIATTDGYVGTDRELYQTVAFSAQRQSLLRLTQMIDDPEALAGSAGEEIQNSIRNLRLEFQGAEGEEALHYKLHEHLTMAVKAGLIVIDCEYGYCLHRPDNKPRCGNKLARRGITVCSGCRNFCPTRAHLPWWQAHNERNEHMILRHVEAGASDTQLQVLRSMTEFSRKMVRSLQKKL
jgi:hypothetical protein